MIQSTSWQSSTKEVVVAGVDLTVVEEEHFLRAAEECLNLVEEAGVENQRMIAIGR